MIHPLLSCYFLYNLSFMFPMFYFYHTGDYLINSARADGGPRPPRLCKLDGSARPPINTSGNCPAHMSAESTLNISPNPSEVISEVSEP